MTHQTDTIDTVPIEQYVKPKNFLYIVGAFCSAFFQAGNSIRCKISRGSCTLVENGGTQCAQGFNADTQRGPYNGVV